MYFHCFKLENILHPEQCNMRVWPSRYPKYFQFFCEKKIICFVSMWQKCSMPTSKSFNKKVKNLIYKFFMHWSFAKFLSNPDSRLRSMSLMLSRTIHFFSIKYFRVTHFERSDLKCKFEYHSTLKNIRFWKTAIWVKIPGGKWKQFTKTY